LLEIRCLSRNELTAFVSVTGEIEQINNTARWVERISSKRIGDGRKRIVCGCISFLVCQHLNSAPPQQINPNTDKVEIDSFQRIAKCNGRRFEAVQRRTGSKSKAGRSSGTGEKLTSLANSTQGNNT
jgi:hypothetical protein